MTADAGAFLRPEEAHIRAMLDIITTPGDPFEVRMLKGRRLTAGGLVDDPYNKAHSGYYTDPALAAAHVARYTGQHFAGAYVTLHQLPPHALAWGARHIAKREKATADKDVTAYRFLYLDFDPARPELTNATVEERRRAQHRAAQVLAYLRDLEWGDPAWAGLSGSGALMLYRIDLPNDTDAHSLYRRALVGLARLFSDAAVNLDTSVYNPARVCRLAGTVNAKAITPQPDRPWALATGTAMPNAGTLTRAQMEAVAAPEPEAVNRPTGEGMPTYDLVRILADSGIRFREKPRAYGTVYEIADCLTSPDHSEGACFVKFTSGAVAYRCLHDRCSGKGWQDVREYLKLPAVPTGTISVRKSRKTATFEIRGGEVVRL